MLPEDSRNFVVNEWFNSHWQRYKQHILISPDSFEKNYTTQYTPQYTPQQSNTQSQNRLEAKRNHISKPFQSVGQLGDTLKDISSSDYYFRYGSSIERELRRTLTHLEVGYAQNNQDHLDTTIHNSGMSAISSLVLALRKKIPNAQDLKFMVGANSYQDTKNFFEYIVPTLGFGPSIFVEVNNLESISTPLMYNPNKIIAFICENLSSPYMEYTNIRQLTTLVQSYNVPLIIDATLLPAFLQQPFRLGADIVIRSMTKYESGQGDIKAGSLTGPKQVIQEIRQMQRYVDTLPSITELISFQERLTTLPERLHQHLDNLQEMKKFLETHPLIERTYYPMPLESVRYAQPGGMLSFQFKGTPQEKETREKNLMQQLINHNHYPISYEVSFGSQKWSMLGLSTLGITSITQPNHYPPGLVRVAIGREPSASQVISFLEKILREI